MSPPQTRPSKTPATPAKTPAPAKTAKTPAAPAIPKQPNLPAPPKPSATPPKASPPQPTQPTAPAQRPPDPARSKWWSIITDATGPDGEPLLPHVLLYGEGFVSHKLRWKLHSIAERLHMRFYRVAIPGEGWRYWFVAMNDGTPLDPTLEPKLVAAIIEKKLYLPRGRLLPGQPAPLPAH